MTDSIQALVRADLEAREKLGIERYGTPLRAHNGRDALKDAYEEALDLACYLKQAMIERGGAVRTGQARPRCALDELLEEYQREVDKVKDEALRAAGFIEGSEGSWEG